MIPRSRQSLRRALWRYRAGWLPENHLSALISRRIQAQARRVAGLEGSVEALRRIDGNLWAAQDETRAEALRRLSWRDYAACADKLLRAERQLDDLHSAATTANRLDAIRTRWQKFVATHDLQLAADCPTLCIPLRLGEVARNLLDRGHLHQAKVVSGILDALCSTLLDRDHGRTEPPDVPHWIAEVTAHDQRYGELLRELRDAGFATLVDRLADDLQAQLRRRVPERALGSVTATDLSARTAEVTHSILSACRLTED